MSTAAWNGFVHSWHTLGIVLKWMCITVVGIPFAIATCILVAAAALAVVLAVTAVASGVGYVIFWILKGILWLVLRIPYWISEFRIHRAERRVFRLPVSEPRPVQQMRVRPGRRGIIVRANIGSNTIVAIPVPAQAHVAPPTSKEGAAPATELPGAIECKVCLEQKLPDEFPSRNPTEVCDHPIQCCKPCLAQSITSALEGRIWDDIRCPICNIQLQHQDVAKFSSKDIFERYAVPTPTF